MISESLKHHQQQAASDSRRRALAARSLTFVLAAGVALALLWAAPIPTLWPAWAIEYFGRRALPPQESATVEPLPSSTAPVAGPANTATAAAVSDGTDSSVSDTPLPLHLLAVAPGRNAMEGTANIGTSIDNPQSYATGAILANGARLSEVHSEYVVLKRGDRSARLYLYDRRNPARISGSDSLLNVGGVHVEVAPQAASREILTDYLRPSPVYDGESLLGYQVYPGTKAGVFAQLGLQPGDVIAAIDDMPLNEPAQALQMMRQLTEGAALKLTIVRNQRREQITVDGSAIAADRDHVEMLGHAPAGEPQSIYR